jgi:hypothetical protein
MVNMRLPFIDSDLTVCKVWLYVDISVYNVFDDNPIQIYKREGTSVFFLSIVLTPTLYWTTCTMVQRHFQQYFSYIVAICFIF